MTDFVHGGGPSYGGNGKHEFGMMKYRASVLVSCLLIAIVALYFGATEVAWARAGGGGGGGGGGRRGLLSWLVALPVAIVYTVILTWLLGIKHRKSRLTLQKAAKDAIWEFDSIKARIEEVYFQVQRAWMARDQELARDCMSDRLHRKHKLQTDAMIANGTVNMLEDINLLSATLVEVLDFQDDSKDQFWVHIEGSMIDYTVKESSGAVVRGDQKKRELFTELWKFVRVNDRWVLDEIDQEVGISDLAFMRSRVE